MTTDSDTSGEVVPVELFCRVPRMWAGSLEVDRSREWIDVGGMRLNAADARVLRDWLNQVIP